MSSFRFQLKDKHPQNILKDTRKLLCDKTNVHLGNTNEKIETVKPKGRQTPSPDAEQMDSDMSFFLRSPSLDATPQIEYSDRGDESNKQNTGFNDLLLDQDDFFSRDIEFQATSTQISKSPFQIPDEIPKPSNTRLNESGDDGELEIVGIQETEKDRKRNQPSSFKPAIKFGSRTTTSKPPLKIRKTGTQPGPSKFTLFPKTDKSIEPLLTAIRNLQTEKQHLQSELNSYIKKYEMRVSQLNVSAGSLKELKNKVESMKGLQKQMDADFVKLNEARLGYEEQINNLNSEKVGMQQLLEELKRKVESLEYSNQQFTHKIRSISSEMSDFSEINMQQVIELALAKDSILSEKEKNKMLSEELDILKLLISDSFGKLNNTASDLDTKMITIEKSLQTSRDEHNQATSALRDFLDKRLFAMEVILLRIEPLMNERLETLSESFQKFISGILMSIKEKVQPFPELKESILHDINKFRTQSDQSSKTILTKQDDLDTRVKSIYDICSNFKSLRLQETEEKRDQYREMSKQITSLSELAQHAQAELVITNERLLAQTEEAATSQAMVRDKLAREYILKELELHRGFEAEKAAINNTHQSKIKEIEDVNHELKATNISLVSLVEQKNGQLLKFQQIDSMYCTLKDEFSKLMQVLEGKEAYVTALEDKLREADYEQLLRGKLQVSSSGAPQIALRNNAKRLLVTSDMSFLEKHEHGSDLYNQLHPEGNMSPKLPSFDCSPLENSLPVTPPNQKIPAETSPYPDTIRILITTDNHVGYNEMDPIRGNDAARTFREAMMVAKDQEVDMILQGGDLFHINKPTRKSMYEVITAIRMACYGDKPCELELMNQVDLGLEEEFNHVNYEDPNINVAIPFFGISGNHDDAAGDSLLSPMDVLAATGLINHFGRVTENDNITISPILLRKGSTKLALYGMANVRDERLFRTFREGQVKFLRPGTDEGEWFNLMAVHQNHVAHTETSYLPESFLPDFLNFILWGHEHDCIIDPTKNPDSGFHVFQPGSSVATSLSEGEAIPKYIAILSIKGTEFSLEKIRLKTVRPFVMRSVSLLEDSGITPHSTEKSEVTKWLIKQVDALIVTAKKEWVSVQDTPVADEDIPLPLIRLKVEYSGGFEVENPRRFSNRFVGQVANVNDVVQFHKRRVTGQHGTRTIRLGEVNTDSLISDSVTLDKLKVQSLVEEYLKESTLELLPENGLGDAISNFVDKDDRQAVKSFVDGSLDIQVSSLLKLGDIDENTLVKAMKKAKIDLSLESEKRPITKLNSVVSVTTSTVSQNVPKSTTSTVSNRSMAARNNTRTSTRGKQRSNEEFGQLIGVLDTIVDESESLDTSSVQDPATKRNTTSTRRRAAKSTVPAAPKPKTTRVRESTKTTAASTKRNTRAKPVSYAEDMDEIDDAEDFQDSGEDDDFEIASEDEEVPSSSVPRLTRRTAPPISNSSSGKTPSPVEEPPKPKSSRIPWQTSTPPASKTPGRKPRATKSSKTGEAPAPTATRASRSRKPAAPQPSEQLRSSMFKLVGSTQNDPMDIDEDDGFN